MKPDKDGKYICPKCKGEIWEDTERGTVGLFHYQNEYVTIAMIEVCEDCMENGVRLAKDLTSSKDLYSCDICGKNELVFGQRSEEDCNGLYCQGCTLILLGILKG